MLKSKISLVWMSFVLCLVLSQSIFAQTQTAVISGRVTDSNGQGISKAIVTAVNFNGSVYSGRTSSFGYYSVVVQTSISGDSFVIFPTGKQHTFNARFEFILGDTTDIDFVALP